MLGFGEVNGSKIHFVKLKIDRLLRGKLDSGGGAAAMQNKSSN